MLLTSEGEALLRYCLAARDLEGEALARIQGAGVNASVRICITGPTSIMRSRIVPQCIPVMKNFVELLVDFKISDTYSWIEDLRGGVAQLAVVPQSIVPKELDSKVLKSERYVLLGSKKWKKRSVVDIVKNERLIDFGANDQMSINYLKKFDLFEYAKKDRHFINNNESLAQLIDAEIGYGVFTVEFAERFLSRCNVAILNDGKEYDHPVALVWYSRPVCPPYWQAILKTMH
jgi:DNA-binding transcriptional LysR family regulator